ncbi:MAG: pyrroline-5-carboxylate reductase [Oscillatoriales cyanobacterium RM1_1_9]|nr:pyrroline-5-carboxylate reductase [Oscillatoriales cyanobacterium SM2_3_0]NJO45631.1 pyrroline-5-carboxylate reductase [Oscillatoriales cyanobacterium RM2_1_1]NJO72080.1 pyrroline-5-carboxylate reductase [Oscillatoriales cyanobacterium RM1_1_9]
MALFKLGLIGGGVMGEALLSRLLDQNLYGASEVLVSEPQVQRRDFLMNQYGIATTANNLEAIQATEALLLAIKPQIFSTLATELASLEQSSAGIASGIVISILAGVTLAQLETAFPRRPVIRVMPNTPATVGAGISAIAPGTLVQPPHLLLAKQIFATVGDVVEVPEYLMDAVTGLSGSGPGYVAVFIEALTDGGVAAGLPRAIAMQLALQTVRGTAELLLQSGLHPAELKDRVTSPGGTTIAGIAQLEQAGFRSALIEAVKTACERSRELGR